MAHVNPHTREVSANIVYYGPAGAGKTATLEFIHRKLRADLRGKLTRVPTQLDPTVSYELIPVELGEIKGLRTRFQIASVPGDPIHGPTRKTLLRDVDGIVFVADSRADSTEANLECLKDLEENLGAYGRALADIPLVFQWNRSDDPGALTSEALDRKLNAHGAESFQTVATDGTGVLQALTTITKLILRRLRADSASKPSPGAGAEGPPPAGARPRTAAPSVTSRVAEPPPPSLAVEAQEESFDPRSFSREADTLSPAPSRFEPPPVRARPTLDEVLRREAPDPEPDQETLGEAVLAEEDAAYLAGDDLPEASLEDLSGEPSREQPPAAFGAEDQPPDPILSMEPLGPGEELTEDFADLGVATDEISPLDIPMEPFEEDLGEEIGEEIGTEASLDAIESTFDPFDFTTEVTSLAERDAEPAEAPLAAGWRDEDAAVDALETAGPGTEAITEVDVAALPPDAGILDEDWEIVSIGAPARVGSSAFTIPIEIREAGRTSREVEVTITLSAPRPPRRPS
jgi:signal recognition particle receptor subunit beta